MGNTIRRQPITRDVPKAPDYKFLNITDFGGLNMTDNPFTAPYNTASDLKNVYVDEFNALTTRPRLAKKHTIKTNLPNDAEIIDVHNLHEGYLIHCKVGDIYFMYRMDSDGFLNSISGDIPTTSCTIFENGEIIYLLDGESYKNIKNDAISNVEGYIPTIIEGIDLKNNIDGFVFEDLNLFSDKYKKTYYWDGSFDLDFTKDANVENVENDYLESTLQFSKSFTNAGNLSEPIKPLKDSSEFSETSELWLGTQMKDLLLLNKNAKGFSTKETVDVFKKYSLVAPTYYNRLYVDVSDDGRFIVLKYYSTSTTKERQNGVGGLFVIDTKREKGFTLFDPTTEYFYQNTDTIYNVATKEKVLKISNDGKVVVSDLRKDGVSRSILNVYVYDDETDTYITKSSYFDGLHGVNMSNDASLICVTTSDGIYYTKDITQTTISWTKISHKLCAPGFDEDGSFILKNLVVSSDGKTIALNRNYYYYNSNNNYVPEKIEHLILVCNDLETESFSKITVEKNPSALCFSDENDKLFFVCESETDELTDGFVLLSNNKIIYNSFTNQTSSSSARIPKFLNCVKNTAYANYVVSKSYQIFKNKYLFDSDEPLLKVTYKLDKTHKEFNTRQEKLKEFSKAKLVTRFKNNWWFATGNKVYYTSNNNPEHMPYNNYSNLGIEQDIITGFNVVQDDTLVAYKRNKLWVIQPSEIDGVVTYSFSESKNTVGNDAFGATIITALTETPLQISYDGIYTLNQLQNVQSSDRISVLISDTISKKWLKESKKSIDNAKTINRLYWTYVVLNDDVLTKVYLLDNRNLMWFYWEFSIPLLNIFVKDNTTHLVDTNGNIYVLTTEDIPSEYVPGKMNYYDDGHKIIDWFWSSQVLPFNTINYSKRLIDTTFILTDSDTQDNYSLNYKFKAYRKLVDETDYTTLQNDIKYVQSVTKKTLVPRFKFLQFELSNDKSDDWDDYNKARLIGLGLKYVLLEVMR